MGDGVKCICPSERSTMENLRLYKFFFAFFKQSNVNTYGVLNE